MADGLPGPNLRRLLVGLDMEGESLWLAAERHHLVTIAIAASCAIIALLGGYVQKTKSLEKITYRVEAVPWTERADHRN